MYYSNITFDSVDKALEFVRVELQKIVEQHNKMVLESEQHTSQIELLSEQETKLRENCNELTQIITTLEGKSETIKRELKEYTKKTTDRLDKERADFELVRAKKRDELINIENSLNIRQEAITQEELRLKGRESDLNDRQTQLEEANQLIISKENDFTKQQQDIDRLKLDNDEQIERERQELGKKADELSQREFVVRDSEVSIDKKKITIDDNYAKSEKHYEKAQELVLLSEDRMNKIELIDKQLKQREQSLNAKEAALKELNKTLESRKIQLDDRSMTINSYK